MPETNNNNQTIMQGVSEYAEGMDVVLKRTNERDVVLALNEAGFNCTEVDLEQLLEWVAKNRPLLYAKFIYKNME